MTLDDRFNPDGLVRTQGYEETMRKEVAPFLDLHREDVMLPGFERRPLFCSRFTAEAPRGTVVLVHGFTENLEKFSELIFSLLQNGYSVCALDQRGHGRSWRKEGLADLSVTHVDKFEEYILDLEIVVDKLLRGMPKPWMLFAHSMGGAVSSLFLEKHQEVFSRVVLCAPMIAPNLGGIPFPLAKLMCTTANRLGKGTSRLLGSKPYTYPDDFATSCANGRERFDWYEGRRKETPEFQNCNPSFNWVLEAMMVTEKILAPGQPEKIGIPLLLYTAEHDNQVLPGPQEAFIQRLPKGRRVFVPGAKHEIYRSTDEIFFPWWHEILGFFAEKE